MEVSEKEMIRTLTNSLITNEKLMYPVFGAIRKKQSKVTGRPNDFAYIALTNLDRLLLYRFDQFSSFMEYYTFDTLIMGDVSKTNLGQYIVELSFLTDKGTKDITLVFSSSVKGFDFPHQEVNSELLYTEIDMKII